MFKPSRKSGKRSFVTAPCDWEANIDRVVLEECAPEEDALGFRARYFVREQAAEECNQKHFTVGASFLGRRAQNLEGAGYKASMTRKALDLLERKLGRPCAVSA